MDIMKRIGLIEEVRNKITNYQNLLLEEEVGSEKYNDLFNELVILKKELDLLTKLTPDNFNTQMKSLTSLNNKFGYIIDLSKDKLEAFLSVVDEYNTFTSGYQQDVNINETLSDFKDRALLSQIKVKGISNANECGDLLELAIQMKSDFLEESKVLKEQLSLVDFSCYNTLYLNVKNKTFSSLDVIKYFYKLDQTTLIDIILKEKKELHKLKKSPFKTKKTEERIEYLKNKLLEREASLLKNIGYYILNVISDIKRKLYVAIDETKFKNFTSLYYETLDKIDDKKEEYDKIIKSLRFAFETYTRLEKGFRTKMNLIDPNLNDEIKSKEIDISNLDSDKMNSLRASVNIYRKFNEPDVKLVDDRSLNF